MDLSPLGKYPKLKITALILSGLPARRYAFEGFLSTNKRNRQEHLMSVKNDTHTLIFYEAPHRIEKTLKLALEVLGDRKACLARELTKLHEEYHRGTLSELCELRDLKGEMVLIIEGKEEKQEDLDPDLLMEEIDQLIKDGMRTKDAVNSIAEKHRVSKNSLYNAYLKRKKEG